jgi:hypothetical protein
MKSNGYKSHVEVTPGVLRARISARQEALRDASPDSWIWWHLHRSIADLENEVGKMEKEGRHGTQ